MKQSSDKLNFEQAQEEVAQLQSLSPLDAAHQLLQMYFRFYEVNKLTAFSNFYYRMMTVEDHLSKKERLDDLLIELTSRYKKRVFWCFTTDQKLNLQQSLLAHIK